MDHKDGIRVLAKLDGENVVRELVSTALALWNGMSTLHTAYAAAAADHPGEVPVVELEDVKQIKNSLGNVSFEPVFQIVDWAPRPDGMPVTAAPRSQPQQKPKAPARAGADMDDEIPF